MRQRRAVSGTAWKVILVGLGTLWSVKARAQVPPKSVSADKPQTRSQRLTGALSITEILASNRRSNADDDGDASDWVELRNGSNVTQNLAGFALSDDESAPTKWKLPAIELEPGEHIVIWASGKDRHVMPQKAVLGSITRPLETVLIETGGVWRYRLARPGETSVPSGWTGLRFDDTRFRARKGRVRLFRRRRRNTGSGEHDDRLDSERVSRRRPGDDPPAPF